MNAKIMKKLNENLPSPLKRLMAGVIRKKMTHNPVFLRQYQQLLQFESLSEMDKKKLQEDTLVEQLRYAYHHTTKYRTLFDEAGFDVNKLFNAEAFQKIPIQMKEDIRSNTEDYISTEKRDFYTAETGGTSGTPLSLWLDKDSIFKERAFIYHFWRKLGYDYNVSKMVTFRGNEKKQYHRFNPVFNEIILSAGLVNKHYLDQYLSLIDDYQPDFLQGYPSAIKNLCRLLREENRRLAARLKGVFFISEEVTPKDRQFIEETLNCKSLAFYGHSERAVFGEEVNPGIYRFHPLYGYTELIPTDIENEYRIIATGFLNKKMPLIRYDTEDIGITNKDGFSIRSHARHQDIVGLNGEIIHIRTRLLNNEMFAVFAKYQFVQHKPGYVDIVILDKNKEKEKMMLESYLKEKFGGIVEFTIKQGDELELTGHGKEKLLIQHIEEDE